MSSHGLLELFGAAVVVALVGVLLVGVLLGVVVTVAVLVTGIVAVAVTVTGGDAGALVQALTLKRPRFDAVSF
jgi:hypothetical protein